MRTLRTTRLHHLVDRCLKLRPWIVLAVLVASSAAGWATEAGLDPGAPVWNGAINQGAWDAVPTTNVQWVRVNFRLDQWSSPYDSGWVSTYDSIVNAYLARGIRVYGVLSDELVHGVPDLNTQAFVDAFTANAVAVVEHFKDRVRTYEVINEPNLILNRPKAVEPWWFAKILQEVYLAVKYNGGHNADPSWQVTLVSGPLYSSDNDSAATYLESTYYEGRNHLAWDWTHTNAFSYPLDGVGYHVYVAQSAGQGLATVTGNTTANLRALWSKVTAQEGAGTPKQIWVSEFGWKADDVGEWGQADRLEYGFKAMTSFGHVAAAFYFQLQDFASRECNNGVCQYGVYSSGGLDAAHRRASADRLSLMARAPCLIGGTYYSSGFTYPLNTVNSVHGSVDAAMGCTVPYAWSLSSGSCPGWYSYYNGQHMYCSLPSYGSATFTATYGGQSRTITFYRNN